MLAAIKEIARNIQLENYKKKILKLEETGTYADAEKVGSGGYVIHTMNLDFQQDKSESGDGYTPPLEVEEMQTVTRECGQ